MKKDLLLGNFLLLPLIITAIGFCAIADADVTQKPILDAEALLEGWESSYSGIKSIEASFYERLVDELPPKEAFKEKFKRIAENWVHHDHTEMIREGKRYHIRKSYQEDGFARPENLKEYAFDGKIAKEYRAANKTGRVQLGMTGRSVENTHLFLEQYTMLRKHRIPEYEDQYPEGLPHLSGLLLWKDKLNIKVLPELEYVAGESCHVLEVTSPDAEAKGYKEKIWLAHNKGMLALKYELYNDDRIKFEILVEEIAKTETETGDFWYPAKAYRRVAVPKMLMSGDEFVAKFEFVMKKFVPNVKIDDNTFRLDFPDGTRVTDLVSGINFVTGVPNMDTKLLVEGLESETIAQEESLGRTENSEPNLNAQRTDANQVQSAWKESKTDAIIGVSESNHTRLMPKLLIASGFMILICGLLFWYKQQVKKGSAGNNV